MSIDLVGIGLLAAAFALLVFTLVQMRQPKPVAQKTVSRSEGPIFLFDGEQMVDCNAAARAILSRSVTRGGDWQRLMAFLTQHFNKIDEKIAGLPNSGAIAETADMGNGKVMLLQADTSGGIVRISLDDPDVAEGPGVPLAIAHHALMREVADLRQAASLAPVLIWRETAQGDVIWANNAYLTHAMTKDGQPSWPLPRLFDRVANVESGEKQRRSFGPNGAQSAAWFDLIVHVDGVQGESGGLLCYAVPADAAVTAETSLREFMDTLAKTFAQLPIGLAVFDKDRVLQMFNPALVELTTLAPDFLARRPRLLAVLDAMRDRNLLPEPKDYRNWRQQILNMERAAASGLFQENWALPDGQTFRVTGRPHPNGGLALMIEDISSETQRSRRYRADLEIGQSVIDHVDDAIAVFTQSGQLMWCNAAYTALWGHDPASSLGEVTIRNMADHWKKLAAPTPLWIEIDEFIHTVGIREAWAKELRLLDGRLIDCAIAPIAAGSTMVAFKPLGAKKAAALAKPSTKATAAR